MTITRRRLQLILLLLFTLILIQPQILFADPIPPKGSYVQDTAGMIPKESVAGLEQAAQGHLYTFYILTINSLEGADPADYATDVYETWKLTADDILILISNGERYVEMNFNNPALQDKIDALPDDYNEDGIDQSKLSEFVERHFIPEAMEGRYANAIINLIEAVNGLKTPASTATPIVPPASSSANNNQDTNNSSTSSDSNDSSTPNVQTPAASNSISGKDTASLLLTVVSLAVIAILITILYIMLRYRGRNQRLQKDIPNVMAELNRSLERIRPYSSLYQGETLKLADSIEREINDLLVSMNASLQELRQIRFTHYLRKAVHEQLKRAQQLYQDKEKAASDLLQQIMNIEDTEKHVSKGLITEKSDLEKTAELLNLQRTSRQWPLTHLEQRHIALVKEHQAIDDMDAFDPMQANTRFIDAKTALDRLEQDIATVSAYAEAYQQFPAKAAQHRARFESLVKDHSLKLIHVDPYALIEQARATSEEMLAELQEGNIPETMKLTEQMSKELSEAVQLVQRLVDLQVKNAADIDRAAEKLAGYPQEDQQLRSIVEHVRPIFRTKHWEDAWTAYTDILPSLLVAEQRLQQVRIWCGLEVQEYERARTELDSIFEQLQKRDDLAAGFTALVRHLEQSLDTVNRQFDAGNQATTAGADVIARNGLIRQWNSIEQELKKLSSGLHGMLNAPPYDIELMQELSERYVRQAESYLQDVERTAVLKRNAENKINEIERSYRSACNRTGRKLNLSRYNGEYAGIRNQVQSLMSQGRYEDAAMKAVALGGIITAMNAAYESILAQERREEAVRRAEEARRRNSSGGGGFGGGNSSGGAGWGGGGRSNSSGGAKW